MFYPPHTNHSGSYTKTLILFGFIPKRKRAPMCTLSSLYRSLIKLGSVTLFINVSEILFIEVIDLCVALAGTVLAVAFLLRGVLSLAVAARLTSAVRGGVCRCGEYNAHEHRDDDEEGNDAQDPPRDLYQYQHDAREHNDDHAQRARDQQGRQQIGYAVEEADQRAEGGNEHCDDRDKETDDDGQLMIDRHIEQHGDTEDHRRNDDMLLVVSAPDKHEVDAGDTAEDRCADEAVQQRREKQYDKVEDSKNCQPRAGFCPQKRADILRLLLIIVPQIVHAGNDLLSGVLTSFHNIGNYTIY